MDNIMNAINEADAIFFGSSTKYGDMIGNMEEVLKNLKTLNLENKLGAAFGSYGWSGEAIEVIQDYLNKNNLRSLNTSDIIKSTGMTDIELPLRIRFSSKEDNLKSIDRIVTYTSDLLFSAI
ncbi:flavorubredoxin [Clostridium beijerinckii]|nr:flavorubredoxin [Clostridium beijerinckii]